MKRINLLAIITLIMVSFSACSTKVSDTEIVEEILTEAGRDSFTPDQVIQLLKDGNRKFVEDELTIRDHSAQIVAATAGQYPKAIILSCIDSRVPVEDVFDRGIGDVFVARVAGNFENTDILGSMEYATKVAGAKVILVLGHGYCGAVKGAIDDVKMGNLTPTLANIKPAIKSNSSYKGEKISSNKEFLKLVIDENVLITINDIRKKSKILREMEESGDIKIVGGVYDIYSGYVKFF